MVKWVLNKLGFVWKPDIPGQRLVGTGIPLYSKGEVRRMHESRARVARMCDDLDKISQN